MNLRKREKNLIRQGINDYYVGKICAFVFVRKETDTVYLDKTISTLDFEFPFFILFEKKCDVELSTDELEELGIQKQSKNVIQVPFFLKFEFIILDVHNQRKIHKLMVYTLIYIALAIRVYFHRGIRR